LDEVPVESFRTWLQHRRGRLVVLSLLCAALFASLYMLQDYLVAAMQGKPLLDPWDLVRKRYLIWGLWALLAPACLLLGDRFRVLGAGTLHRLPFWLAIGLLAGLVHSGLFLVLEAVLGWQPPESGPLLVEIWRRASGGVASNLLVFSAVALAYHAAAHAYDLDAAARHQAILETRLARSELQRLKLQLQPHFVFNTLQTVSALMPNDVGGARRVLALLGELLRHSLDSVGVQLVPLGDEVCMLRKYLDIQQTRFQARLQVDFQIDAGVLELLVPSMMLQPLVENAIRHGIEPRSSGGRVEIAASRHEGRLRVTVVDDGVGLSQCPPATSREGVGLLNTRARLAQLYGAAGVLSLSSRPGGGAQVMIEIPVNGTAPQPVPSAG
jgi:two-component system, LytTR family, sensor kinase